MGVPVGDILRSFVAPGSFLGRILAALRGVKITVSGTEIDLDQNQGIPGLKQSPFDSKPAKFEPPTFGGHDPLDQ